MRRTPTKRPALRLRGGRRTPPVAYAPSLSCAPPKHSILRKIRASDDRFEISPTLKFLFSAEEILVLTRTYHDMNVTEKPVDQEMPSAEEARG